MRIYAAADIHGKRKNIERVKDAILQQSPDILVLAGDITHYFSPLRTLHQMDHLPIPLFGIRGNSDLTCVEKYFQEQKNATLLTHVPVTYRDFRFLGLNGTIPLPFFSKISFHEAQCCRRLEQHMNDKTILVVHPPPRGLCDKVGNKFCAGSAALKRLIETHPPFMVLCGHIHEQAGYQFLNNTLVVNCAMNKRFSGAIIECGNNISLTVKMVSTDK